jgi:hypothetical protein
MIFVVWVFEDGDAWYIFSILNFHDEKTEKIPGASIAKKPDPTLKAIQSRISNNGEKSSDRHSNSSTNIKLNREVFQILSASQILSVAN